MHYTLCDLLSDLTQNAIEAKAKKITVQIYETDSQLSFSIQDNGHGMDKETLDKIKNPFFTDGIKHPNRKIGLGIPFLIQTAMQSDGEWAIESKEGEGTKISGSFSFLNIDTPPLGSLISFFRQILSFSKNYEMLIERKKETQAKSIHYSLLRSELIDALGDLESIESLTMLEKYLENQEEFETLESEI